MGDTSDSPSRRSPSNTRKGSTNPTSARDQTSPEAVSTPEIQNWMSAIEQCLNEICSISTEGKLNSDQKLRVHNLCRKVSHGTANLAVNYQALKQKALINQCNLQALEEQQDLSECIRALKKSIDTRPTTATTDALSFADMVKTKNNIQIRPSNLSSVAIYPKDQTRTSEQTKNLVQEMIKPEQLKLHVRALRKVRNGGVIISTESKDDIEKLKKKFKDTSPDLTIDEPFKRRPRIVIVGVQSALREEEFYNCLFEQNLAEKLPNLTRDKILSSIQLSHKSGKKESETCNYIIEVPALIRKIIITQSRVYINWSSCPVRDFTIVTRCFKCQQYGHAAKTCKQPDQTCGHCCSIGHADKMCPSKDNPPKCATCKLFKKPNDHKTGDPDCPARIMAERLYIYSIDYEGI